MIEFKDIILGEIYLHIDIENDSKKLALDVVFKFLKS